jgi:hypothetical protein
VGTAFGKHERGEYIAVVAYVSNTERKVLYGKQSNGGAKATFKAKYVEDVGDICEGGWEYGVSQLIIFIDTSPSYSSSQKEDSKWAYKRVRDGITEVVLVSDCDVELLIYRGIPFRTFQEEPMFKSGWSRPQAQMRRMHAVEGDKGQCKCQCGSSH